MLRRITGEPDIDLRVIFERVMPEHRYFDEGFQREVRWDVPLTEGYDFAALDDTSLEREISNCDVLWVHGWQTAQMRRAIRVAAGSGKPVLMRGENCEIAMPDGRGIKGWLKRRYLARIFANCRAFLTIGSLNRSYYRARDIDDARMFHVPYAIDNTTFADAADRARAAQPDLRDMLNIDRDAPVILYAGKLSKRKHPELLADAVRALNDMSPKPVLVYAGDGEMMAEMKTRAPDALFVGFINQSELPAFYAMADVFVLPSEMEPWGLAVNEAMACGTAVVVSDQVGAAPDLVDESCGAVFESGNVNALVSALRRCLATSDEMGAKARQKISGWDFSADVDGLKQALQFVSPQP